MSLREREREIERERERERERDSMVHVFSTLVSHYKLADIFCFNFCFNKKQTLLSEHSHSIFADHEVLNCLISVANKINEILLPHGHYLTVIKAQNVHSSYLDVWTVIVHCIFIFFLSGNMVT